MLRNDIRHLSTTVNQLKASPKENTVSHPHPFIRLLSVPYQQSS
jgi:hypothetical protein